MFKYNLPQSPGMKTGGLNRLDFKPGSYGNLITGASSIANATQNAAATQAKAYADMGKSIGGAIGTIGQAYGKSLGDKKETVGYLTKNGTVTEMPENPADIISPIQRNGRGEVFYPGVEGFAGDLYKIKARGEETRKSEAVKTQDYYNKDGKYMGSFSKNDPQTQGLMPASVRDMELKQQNVEATRGLTESRDNETAAYRQWQRETKREELQAKRTQKQEEQVQKIKDQYGVSDGVARAMVNGNRAQPEAMPQPEEMPQQFTATDETLPDGSKLYTDGEIYYTEEEIQAMGR